MPEESLNLAQQLQDANKRIKELEKDNRELKEQNEFLEEASAFFAASRRKSGKFNIEKHETRKPDAEMESIKTEIIRIDSEIQKIME